MRTFLLPGLLSLLLAGAAAAQGPETSRGQLLYSTHCIECHSTQMHWRAARLARDWDTLKAQVRRWQGEAQLGWGEPEVDAVARYLNDTVYRFPRQVALAPR